MNAQATDVWEKVETALLAAGFSLHDNAWVWRNSLGYIRIEFIHGHASWIRATWTDGRARDVTFFDLGDNSCLGEELLAWAGFYAQGGTLGPITAQPGAEAPGEMAGA